MANVIVTNDRYTVDSLYQWDLNQVLEIHGLSLPSIPEIHFTSGNMDRAIVRQSQMDDAGIITVDIPNSLLQKSSAISVYVCIYEGDTFKSMYKIVVPVKARTQPADYTITDNDGEIYSFKALENLCVNLLAAYDEVDQKHKTAISNLQQSANIYNQTSKLIEEYRTALDDYETELDEYKEAVGEYEQAVQDYENQVETLNQNVDDAVTPLYCVCETTSDTAAKVATLDNYVLRVGQTVRVKFVHFVMAGATLNINNTGDIPLYGNSSPLMDNVIIDGYVADLVYNGQQYDLLNPHIDGEQMVPLSGYNFYTTDATFVVPAGITAIRVSACAAGIGQYAGESIVDRIFNVTPGQSIDLTIGSGNTVIGDFATLIAGSATGAQPTTKLGYAAGYNGGGTYNGEDNVGGAGGAFGFGGGDARKATGSGEYAGGGGGIGGHGAVNAAGGTTGGDPGSSYSTAGGDAKTGKIIYKGGTGTLANGGGGSIYGGGGGAYKNSSGYGGGGAAGGYGAGCGVNGDGSVNGDPSPGMVLIEWGGTIGE